MKKLTLLFFALCMAASTWAYSFASGGIYYNITSSTAPYTVEVAGCDNGLTTLTIPASVDSAGTTYAVTAIGDQALSNKTFTSVFISTSVTSIGREAFSFCRVLTSMTIPSSVTSIGSFAFSGAGFSSVDIQAPITTIEPYTFCSCGNLKSITIPSTVKTVGERAFWDCAKLDTVRVPVSVDSIAFNAFLNDTSLTAISVDPSNANYTDVDGVLLNKSQTKLVCYPAGKTAPSYTIPSTVTCIDSAAFYFSKLNSVIIPVSVNNIGNNAFEFSSKLSSIYAYPVTPVSFADKYQCLTFNGVDTAHCVLHVPAASLADYKSAYVWKGFKIQGDLAAGLTSISADVKITVANGELQLVGISSGETLGVYNTVGASIYTGKSTGSALSISLPAHGVYIVQLGNASRKVIY